MAKNVDVDVRVNVYVPVHEKARPQCDRATRNAEVAPYQAKAAPSGGVSEANRG